MPLRRHLSTDGGDPRGARGDGGENSAVEEVILPAGEEFPLVYGAAAGRDGNRLLGGQVVEELVMLALVVGDGAGIADRGIQRAARKDFQ